MGIFSLFQTVLNKFTKNMLIDKSNLNNGKYHLTEVIVFSDDDYNGKIEDRSYILNSNLPYHASFKEVENSCVSTSTPAQSSIKHTIRLRYHPVDRTSTFADEQGNPISDRVIDDILRPTNDDFLFVRNIDGTLSIFNLKTDEFYYNNKFIIDYDYYYNVNIGNEVGKVYKHFKNCCCNQGNIFPLVFKNDNDEICVLNGRLMKFMPNIDLLCNFKLISPYIYINNRKYKLCDGELVVFQVNENYYISNGHLSPSPLYNLLSKYDIDKDKLAQTIADVFNFEAKMQ